jgi:hypothetical protein
MWVYFRIDIFSSGRMGELLLALLSPVILSFSIFLFHIIGDEKDGSSKLGVVLVCLLLTVIGFVLTMFSNGVTGVFSA